MKVLAMLVLGISFLFASVDINSADKEELMTLKGIGAKKADAILKYRNSECFKSVDSLVEVKGIGVKFIEKNRESLTAGKCRG